MRVKIAQPSAKTIVTQLELVGLRGKLLGIFIQQTVSLMDRVQVGRSDNEGCWSYRRSLDDTGANDALALLFPSCLLRYSMTSTCRPTHTGWCSGTICNYF